MMRTFLLGIDLGTSAVKALLTDADGRAVGSGRWWQQGYCTEAARAMLDYAFAALDLNRVQARHLTRNPASGRVMQKAGMTYEGVLRQAIFRWNRFDDLAIYSILRSEYFARARP